MQDNQMWFGTVLKTLTLAYCTLSIQLRTSGPVLAHYSAPDMRQQEDDDDKGNSFGAAASALVKSYTDKLNSVDTSGVVRQAVIMGAATGNHQAQLETLVPTTC